MKAVNDITQRLPDEGHDEISEFASLLNSSLDRIEEAYHALSSSEVRARTLAEKALEASRVKSEFLSNISHELRTPLSGILGNIHLLLESDVSESQRNDLVAARDSARALLSLINHLLDFSAIEVGRARLTPNDFSVRKLAGSLFELLEHDAEESNITMVLEVRPEVPEILWGDARLLRQILSNLLSNAMKFSVRGGAIFTLVELQKKSNGKACLHFVVVDAGIGIPDDKQQLIFEAFQQGDGSLTRRFGGTGVGLAASRKLAEMMGGTMWVRSQPETGSAFHFTVWLDENCPDLHNMPKLSDACQVQETPVSHLSAAESTFTDEVNPAHEGRGERILIAEDNAVNQKLICRMLSKHGFSVTSVEDGMKALELFKREVFSLVLMDCQMPNMDGYEASRLIREWERDKNSHVPIVALTAHLREDCRAHCLASGMDDLLTKPVDTPTLLGTIRAHIGSHGTQVH